MHDTITLSEQVNDDVITVKVHPVDGFGYCTVELTENGFRIGDACAHPAAYAATFATELFASSVAHSRERSAR